jgi:hypothetical protein
MTADDHGLTRHCFFRVPMPALLAARGADGPGLCVGEAASIPVISLTRIKTPFLDGLGTHVRSDRSASMEHNQPERVKECPGSSLGVLDLQPR